MEAAAACPREDHTPSPPAWCGADKRKVHSLCPELALCSAAPFRTLFEALKAILPRRIDEPTAALPWVLDLIVGLFISRGATKEQISSIAYKTIQGDEKPDEKCAICLGNYLDGEDVRLLRCSHNYHNECIDSWLERRNTCPVCKAEAC